MTYVSWVRLFEGASDALYFDVLLPRLMEDIILSDGVRHSDIPVTPAVYLGDHGRGVSEFAKEACGARQAFSIVFIHGDTGGRALEEGLNSRTLSYCKQMQLECDWPLERCVVIAPRHETEAWVLADPEAVMATLGYRGDRHQVGLPKNAREAERLLEPKATLRAAISKIAGSRRRTNDITELFPAIAQRQNFDFLRMSDSFQAFEAKLKTCLRHLGCIS